MMKGIFNLPYTSHSAIQDKHSSGKKHGGNKYFFSRVSYCGKKKALSVMDGVPFIPMF